MTRARRASRPRFRLLPTLLLTLAILGVPTVVYAWGRSSSSFDIAHVRVAGTHLVRDKRALRLLTREYAGHNLFTVTGGDVRKTLAPLRLVADATVDRDFPDTLSVTVTEYEPAAYALAGDRWYVLDESGYVICTAAEAADQLGAAEEAGRRRVGLAVALRVGGGHGDPGAWGDRAPVRPASRRRAPTASETGTPRRRPAGRSPAVAPRGRLRQGAGRSRPATTRRRPRCSG